MSLSNGRQTPGLIGTAYIQSKYGANIGTSGHTRHIGPDSPTPPQIAPNPLRRLTRFICYLLSSSSSASSVSHSAAAPAPQPLRGSPAPAPEKRSRPRRGGRRRRPGCHRGTSGNSPTQLMNFLQMHHNLRDQQVHTQLLNDLMEHMWIHNGNQGGNA